MERLRRKEPSAHGKGRRAEPAAAGLRRVCENFGFEIVGPVPRAFAHRLPGDVDAFVMLGVL